MLAAFLTVVRLLVTLVMSSDSSLFVNNRQGYLEPDGVALEL